MPGPYTAKQVADMIGVNDSRIRQLALDESIGVGAKFGRVWMFTDEDVAKIREQQAPRGRKPKPTPPTEDTP